jgi:hypothetical protein
MGVLMEMLYNGINYGNIAMVSVGQHIRKLDNILRVPLWCRDHPGRWVLWIREVRRCKNIILGTYEKETKTQK